MIELSFEGEIGDIIDGIALLQKRLDFRISEDGYVVNIHKSKSMLMVEGNNAGYCIMYHGKADFFRGLSILIYKIKNNELYFSVNETPKFDTCGVMIDVSRNAVLTVGTAKDLVMQMALMGLDMLMLYTEDTYEIPKYPWFGYMRGAYTKNEIKEIDSFCNIFGIELIPCIQTLAHLSTTLRWKYAENFKDQPDVMMVGCDDTYELIDEMFRTTRECFTSNRIHVGLDESFGMGLGNYLKKNGYKSTYDLMLEHINKVVALAEKYNYKPMMWSDMFFREGEAQGDYNPKAEVPKDASERLPENIEMVFWEYVKDNYDEINCIFDKHADIGREIIFAGGIWTWGRLIPNMKKTFKTARVQLDICKKLNIKTVFATIWGSSSLNGCNIYSILPGLQMYAEQKYYDDVSDEHLSEMFNICTGYKMNDFMSLYIDDFNDDELEKYADKTACCVNPSYQCMFNDILHGLMDKTFEGYDFKSRYINYLSILNKIKPPNELAWLFDYFTKMAEVLVIKCDIGVRLTYAYKLNNMNELNNIVKDMQILLKKYEDFHVAIGKAWHIVYKPFGWDSLDMHFGAIESRIKWAILRVQQYINGEITEIKELEAERFYYNEINKPLTEVGMVSTFMTASVF